MNGKNLNAVSSITFSGFETSNFFIKSNGLIDENDYIQATDTVITDLQAKTQNISATSTQTTFTKNNTFIIPDGTLDTFAIKDAGAIPVSKFEVGTCLNLIMMQ